MLARSDLARLVHNRFVSFQLGFLGLVTALTSMSLFVSSRSKAISSSVHTNSCMYVVISSVHTCINISLSSHAMSKFIPCSNVLCQRTSDVRRQVVFISAGILLLEWYITGHWGQVLLLICEVYVMSTSVSDFITACM